MELHTLPNPLGNRRSDIKLKLLYVFKSLIVELENALGKVPHEHRSATETNNENIFIYFISSGMDLEVVFVAGWQLLRMQDLHLQMPEARQSLQDCGVNSEASE